MIYIKQFIPPILLTIYNKLKPRVKDEQERNSDKPDKYKIGIYEIEIPTNFTLPDNQKYFKLYDRFLPVLAKNISSDKIIIDVGANIGDTAIAILPDF